MDLLLAVRNLCLTVTPPPIQESDHAVDDSQTKHVKSPFTVEFSILIVLSLFTAETCFDTSEYGSTVFPLYSESFCWLGSKARIRARTNAAPSSIIFLEWQWVSMSP